VKITRNVCNLDKSCFATILSFLQTFASFVIYGRILFGHGIRVIKHSAKSLVIEMAVMLVVT